MKSVLLFILCTSLFHVLPAQAVQNDEILRNLLAEFLDGASVNDYATHDRFWADDLIYTSSDGERIGKADIMNGLPAEGSTLPDEDLPFYSADDVQINLYGKTAIVAFRLVAEVPLENGGVEVMNFYNTGTFLKRNGEWKAVAWQATSIPG